MVNLCKRGIKPSYNTIVGRWIEKLPSDKEYMVASVHKVYALLALCISHHRPRQKTLTWLGNQPRKSPPCKSGGFTLKGSAMKKYYPVDFDEKGNAVLGAPKNTPTSNGFIPTTWAPGGGGGDDEGKQGLKSISISPAITTTPALDSLFPIYWDDLTEEEKQSGEINRGTTANASISAGEYVITFTPTSDWYAADTDTFVFGEKGQPVTTSVLVDGEQSLRTSVMVSNGTTQETSTEYFTLTFIVGLPD